MVRRAAFREDLFWRLDVLRVKLPELRERAGDVPALAEHLLSEIAREQGAPALGFTEPALDALGRHPWPGNVRELRNVLERALLSARGRRVDTGDLPPSVRAGTPAAAAELAAGPLALADVERDHIAKVLSIFDWNRSAAAKALGIDRRTLFSKIQRYGLVGPMRSQGESEGEYPDGDA